MSNPPADQFNKIVLKYTCSRCNAKVSGERYAVPGSHLMGRSLMMQYVCRDCLDAHHDAVNDGFWGEMSKQQGGVCHACPTPLERGESHLVHRSLKGDGTWEHARICADCFSEYKSLCTKLAAGNRK